MKLLITLILIFVSFVIYIRWLEMTAVFDPSRNLKSTPADLGMVYEDVYLETKDKFKINGWFIKGASEGIILYFHGNAGTMSHSLAKAQMFHQLGLGIFLVDYRGFGRSEGFPTEIGIYRDAQAAYDYLVSRPDVNRKNIVIYGESLGSAVAIDLASKNQSCGVIIHAAFTNIVDMAKRQYPFIPSFFIGTQFDSLSKVGLINQPKIFIHSPTDELIPFQLGKNLYDAANQPKVFYPIEGDHNTNSLSGIETIRRVLEDIFQTDKSLCPSLSLSNLNILTRKSSPA